MQLIMQSATPIGTRLRSSGVRQALYCRLVEHSGIKILVSAYAQYLFCTVVEDNRILCLLAERRLPEDGFLEQTSQMSHD